MKDDRNPNYGYIPWDCLKPGESLIYPAVYSSLVAKLNRRYCGKRRFYSHRHPSLPDRRVLIRLK